MLSAQHRFETGSQALKKHLNPDGIVVLINTPIELIANYTLAMAAIEVDGKYAGALHQLYAGASELWVERTAERVIEVTATRGWGHVPLERIFCAAERMREGPARSGARGGGRPGHSPSTRPACPSGSVSPSMHRSSRPSSRGWSGPKRGIPSPSAHPLWASACV